MKKKNFLLLLLITSIGVSCAQTLFTDVTGALQPVDLEIKGNQLFVTEFNTRDVTIIDLEDPFSATEVLVDNPGNGPGVWTLEYDDDMDYLYISDFSSAISRVNVSDTPPATLEQVFMGGLSYGMVVKDNVLYAATNNSIIKNKLIGHTFYL